MDEIFLVFFSGFHSRWADWLLDIVSINFYISCFDSCTIFNLASKTLKCLLSLRKLMVFCLIFFLLLKKIPTNAKTRSPCFGFFCMNNCLVYFRRCESIPSDACLRHENTWRIWHYFIFVFQCMTMKCYLLDIPVPFSFKNIWVEEFVCWRLLFPTYQDSALHTEWKISLFWTF